MKAAGRVLGWDFLRGICALAVAIYHLLLWQGVGAIHTWGSYGVYIFFVLSGASLAYTYADRISHKNFSFVAFLSVRYWRLAPLYLALMVIVLPWKLSKETSTTGLLLDYVTNATFLFGFLNPSTHSVLIGGWSLGIEAVFYLFFPLLMLSFKAKWGAPLVFFMLLILQAGWIHATVGGGNYVDQAELYHHAPAFAAYFMGGCLIGVDRLQRVSARALSVGAFSVLMLSGFAVMLIVNPNSAGQELIGLHGPGLAALCFVMVYLAGKPRVTDRMATLCRYLGDATYGVYLLHPVLFFGLSFFVFPRLAIPPPTQWSLPGQLILGLVIVSAAFALALASERFFEKPIRSWSRKRFKSDRSLPKQTNQL